MIEPSIITSPTVCMGSKMTNEEGQIDSSTRSPKSRRTPNDSEELYKTETFIIEAARWAFFSNRIVAYWPISKKLFVNGRKCLKFHRLTIGFFLSLFYILFNIIYIIHYHYLQSSEEAKLVRKVDQILITIWDLTLIASVTVHRIYALMRMSKFNSFWNGCVGVVAQYTALSSEKETTDKFACLRRWTLKWLIVFALFGILDCCSVIYHMAYVRNESVVALLLAIYLEAVICMHNSSALMLIFFIKVITYGFTVCKRKVEQLSLQTLDSRRTTSPFCHDNENFNECKQRESVHVPSSSSLTLTSIFKLVNELENCVDSFNHVFGFSLFLEAVLGIWQVLFAMYFLANIQNTAIVVNMAVPIAFYSICLVALCVASSKLTEECVVMLASFQRLSWSSLSAEENYKIQILVSRLSPAPSGIQVAQLFQIRESLLGSVLNSIATYFIVLVQMRQTAVSSTPLDAQAE